MNIMGMDKLLLRYYTFHLLLALVVVLLANCLCIKAATIYPSHNATITNITRMYDSLRHIPEGAETVRHLNLGYNHLTHLDNNTFVDNRYKNVKKIYLCRNLLTDIAVHAFKGLAQLETVDLSDNNITALRYNTFAGNAHLKELILVNNYIRFERQQTFIRSHSLQTLILSNNRITEIYDMTFISLTNLKRLILTDNDRLVTLSPICFHNLASLKYLSLINTGVHTINLQMFDKLPRIINVQDTPFAHNFQPPLTQLTSDRMRDLLTLDKLYKYN